MKFKMLSIAAITTLALSISSVYAGKNTEMKEANDFLKNLSAENIDEDNNTDSNNSLDDLEKEFANLENSITGENVVVGKVKDGKIEVKEVEEKPDGQAVNDNDQEAQDMVFLKNVPEGTRLTMTKDFVILPQNQYVIFHNGDRVIQSPIYQNPASTFCYIELKQSGKARVIKEGKQFTVTKNETKSFIKTLDQGQNLKVYYSKIFVDNKSVNFISCYSAEKSLGTLPKAPLTVKDMREQTGGSFKLEFPAYEEI